MRTIKIQTGIGGYDLFNIAFEESAGLKRIRIGNKVPRILRTKKSYIKQSPTGYWYKLIKTEKNFFERIADDKRTRYKKEDFSLEMIENSIKNLFGGK